MEELIGMQFKRNVYGPSIWTDTVKDINIRWKFNHPFDGTQHAEIIIVGENTSKIGVSFPLSEVIFLRPLDFAQRWQQKKKEDLDKMHEEWLNKQTYKKE